MTFTNNIGSSVVGLMPSHYARLEKMDFFYSPEYFILNALLQLDCCNLLFTRHDTFSQNSVLCQNTIIMVIIEVWHSNQTHPETCAPEQKATIVVEPHREVALTMCSEGKAPARQTGGKNI